MLETMDTQKMEKFNYTNKTDAEMIRISHVVPYVGPDTFVITYTGMCPVLWQSFWVVRTLSFGPESEP